MSDTGNQNLPVVEAKAEYTKNLKLAMSDTIVEKMYSMYEEALKDTEQKNEVLMTYQKQHLKKVLDWSNNHVNMELEKIKKNCNWFNELLTAVIVTNVKILTSVKFNKTSKKVQVKMPSAEKFIHQVFINVARKVYDDPYIVSRRDTDTLQEIIDRAIDNAIRNTVPIESILQMYVGEGADSDEEEEEEVEDEAGSEPDEDDDKDDDDDDKEEGFEDGANDEDAVPDIDALTPKPEETPTPPAPAATSFFDPPADEIRNVTLNPQPNPMAPQATQMQQPVQTKESMMGQQPQPPVQNNPTFFDDAEDP